RSGATFGRDHPCPKGRCRQQRLVLPAVALSVPERVDRPVRESGRCDRGGETHPPDGPTPAASAIVLTAHWTKAGAAARGRAVLFRAVPFIRRCYLFMDSLAKRHVEHGRVILAWKDLDDRVAAELGQ